MWVRFVQRGLVYVYLKNYEKLRQQCDRMPCTDDISLLSIIETGALWIPPLLVSVN